MFMVLDLLFLFSAVSFLFYGIGCFINPKMKEEFIRYGVPQYREFTGLLQILGGLGIVIGFWETYLLLASTLGLSLLMLFGVIIRIKIKDPLLKTLPAIFYGLLNAYLSFELVQVWC
jgi:uncharacterized membrane protein YphA (DoxX/SURF4 family)